MLHRLRIPTTVLAPDTETSQRSFTCPERALKRLEKNEWRELVLADLQTNRDLYLAIETLTEKHKSCTRSLEQYLLALLRDADAFTDSESLSLSHFYNLIAQSFTSKPHEFDDNWRTQYDKVAHDSPDFNGWRTLLIRQIVDLREMDETGTLSIEHRNFGVDSPRNSRWYNFDPSCYIERAMTGSFGGWEPGDESEPEFVRGPVAALPDDGSSQDRNPKDIPRPQFAMTVVTWEQFKSFIYCGQIYE